MKKVYLSPSTQERNIGYGKFGTEEFRANQITDVIETMLELYKVKIYRNKPDMKLSAICQESNLYDVDAHIAIHTNACNTLVRGCEVFCHNKGIQGEILATKIYNKIEKITPSADRGVKYGYDFYGEGQHLYETNNTTAPSCLVEIDFHDNKDSAEWIINNIELIGNEIALAILDFLKVDIKPEKKDVLYRVIVGSYADKANALKHIKRLKECGQEAFTILYKK